MTVNLNIQISVFFQAGGKKKPFNSLNLHGILFITTVPRQSYRNVTKPFLRSKVKLVCPFIKHTREQVLSQPGVIMSHFWSSQTVAVI